MKFKILIPLVIIAVILFDKSGLAHCCSGNCYPVTAKLNLLVLKSFTPSVAASLKELLAMMDKQLNHERQHVDKLNTSKTAQYAPDCTGPAYY